jgi:hypothetical protein
MSRETATANTPYEPVAQMTRGSGAVSGGGLADFGLWLLNIRQSRCSPPLRRCDDGPARAGGSNHSWKRCRCLPPRIGPGGRVMPGAGKVCRPGAGKSSPGREFASTLTLRPVRNSAVTRGRFSVLPDSPCWADCLDLHALNRHGSRDGRLGTPDLGDTPYRRVSRLANSASSHAHDCIWASAHSRGGLSSRQRRILVPWRMRPSDAWSNVISTTSSGRSEIHSSSFSDFQRLGSP